MWRHPGIVYILSKEITILVMGCLQSAALVWPTEREVSISLRRKTYAILLTAAAKSICPGPEGLGCSPWGGTTLLLAFGLDAVGTGGFPGIFGATGFAAKGGPGFGFVAIGGPGLSAREVEGLEFAGVDSADALEAAGAFFQGVADPLEGTIPGNTETGLAEESAITGMVDALGVLEATGALGIGRRFGGGGGPGVALGLGGMSSR